MVHLGNDWDEILAGEFEQDYYKRIRYWLKKEYAEQTIYPAAENIFNALRSATPSLRFSEKPAARTGYIANATRVPRSIGAEKRRMFKRLDDRF